MADAKREIASELHAPARRNYIRRHVSIRGFKDLFQADLVEMIPYEKDNSGYRYMLTVIDVFSKYAWARPVLKKDARNVTNAMRDILQCDDGARFKPPRLLQTDRGKEFYNATFQKLLSDFNVSLYSTYSTKKANYVERWNRTIKTKMWKEFSARGTYRWIDMLPRLISDYNNSYHRSIKMAPSKVQLTDEKKLLSLLATQRTRPSVSKSKFKEGDIVRVSHFKGVFEKGYTPNWSTELFKIKIVCPTRPVTYKLEDLDGNPILGGFYKEELLPTRFPDIYLVEKVIKTRGNKAYVKFLGFDKSHNMWIPKSDILPTTVDS